MNERYPKFEVGESTVRRYVRELRKEYNIPKTTRKKVYEAVPDLSMGFQAQVDFGQSDKRMNKGSRLSSMYTTCEHLLS